jgi:mortality factor 4-like protein 1
MLKWEEKNLVHQKKLMAEHRATTGKDDERKHERRSSIHHKEKDPKEKDKDRDGHHLREKGHDKDHHHKEKDKDKDSHGTKDPKMSNKREARVKKATKEEEGYGTELYNWNVAPTKRKTEVKLVIPDILKMVLVDDWEAVTKNGQVSHLILV